MTKLLYIIAIIFIFTSCYNINKTEPVIPDILLSKSQMVDMLTEIQITEANFRIAKNRTLAVDEKPKYYDRILREYGITLKQMKDNMEYYHNSPEIMEEIYEQVLANLSKIQSEVMLEKEELEKAIIADSIARMNDSLELVKIDNVVNIQ